MFTLERLKRTRGDAMGSAATYMYVDVVYNADRGPQNVATTACVPLSRAQYGAGLADWFRFMPGWLP